jgi:hypothetical protein
MAHMDFQRDHKVAVKTEQQVTDFLLAKYPGLKFEHFCGTADYDVAFSWPGRQELIKVEIKEDFTCKRTGNVGLEFSCRGKPSGISISKADRYIYKVHRPDGRIVLYSIPTDKLKRMVKNHDYSGPPVNGGDPGSNSMNYLFKLGMVEHRFDHLGDVE